MLRLSSLVRRRCQQRLYEMDVSSAIRPRLRPPSSAGWAYGTATALNMIDMIGVGPFITMPLVLSAMGGPQALLGWIVGALLAVCDGLVSAELGAALPASGGSYRYLREIYGPQKWGRLISFLFIWQVSFQRAPFDCHWMHRPGGIRRLLLAGTRHGICPSRRCSAHPVGWPAAGQLDRHTRNRRRRRDLLLHRTAALPPHHGDRATFKDSMVWSHGNHRLDHLRRADSLQRRSGIRFSSRRLYTFSTILYRTGRGNARRDLRLLGLLQRLLPGR